MHDKHKNCSFKLFGTESNSDSTEVEFDEFSVVVCQIDVTVFSSSISAISVNRQLSGTQITVCV